jgi:hypothetical protein
MKQQDRKPVGFGESGFWKSSAARNLNHAGLIQSWQKA